VCSVSLHLCLSLLPSFPPFPDTTMSDTTMEPAAPIDSVDNTNTSRSSSRRSSRRLTVSNSTTNSSTNTPISTPKSSKSSKSVAPLVPDYESIRVCLRFRPLNKRELAAGMRHAWRVDEQGHSVVQLDEKSVPMSSSQHTFDHVFDADSNTDAVYQRMARNIVTDITRGMNGTLFAYGQTSSGKTYTMRGCTKLAIQDLFHAVTHDTSRTYSMQASYIEIYNEVINDLLDTSKTNLKVHENIKSGVFIGGLTEVPVSSRRHVHELLSKGESNRQTGSTNMNEKSSRSHTIVRIVVTSVPASPDLVASGATSASKLTSVLHLVDLAGSERQSHTKAAGLRLKEGGMINKSLLTLATVIRKLSNNSGHIPYRDSKLTRILQSALGGNNQTAIICCVTLASMHIEETSSTIGFASRAKSVKNVAKINEIVDDKTIIKRLKQKIVNLKRKFRTMSLRGDGGSSTSTSTSSSSQRRKRSRASSAADFLEDDDSLCDISVDDESSCPHIAEAADLKLMLEDAKGHASQLAATAASAQLQASISENEFKARFQSAFDLSKEQNRRYQKCIHNLLQQVDEKDSTMSAMTIDAETIKSAQQSLHQELETQSKNLAQATEAADAFRSQQTTVVARLSEAVDVGFLGEEHEMLENGVEELIDALEYQKDIARSAEEENAKLRSQIESMTAQMAVVTETRSNLAQRANAAPKVQQRPNYALQFQRQTAHRLWKSVQSLSAQNDLLETGLADANEAIATAGEERDLIQHNMENLAERLVAAEARAVTETTSHAKLQVQLQTVQDEYNNAKFAQQESDEQNAELETQVKHLSDHVTDLADQLDLAKQSEKSLQHQVIKLRGQMAVLTGELDEKEMEIEKLIKKIPTQKQIMQMVKMGQMLRETGKLKQQGAGSKTRSSKRLASKATSDTSTSAVEMSAVRALQPRTPTQANSTPVSAIRSRSKVRIAASGPGDMIPQSPALRKAMALSSMNSDDEEDEPTGEIPSLSSLGAL
jgi:centromeric protein E